MFDEYGMQGKVMGYQQVSEIVIDILDQAVDVIGNDLITINEFYKILNAGFQNKEIGIIPIALDQVNIGDIARIKVEM